MKIAVIGKGNVGGTLGAGWTARGHDVIYGVRDTPKENGDTKTAVLKEAVQWGEVIVLAVPWNAVPSALRSAGDLTGRILLDATNPLLPNLSGLDSPDGISGGEQVASLVRGIPV